MDINEVGMRLTRVRIGKNEQGLLETEVFMAESNMFMVVI